MTFNGGITFNGVKLSEESPILLLPEEWSKTNNEIVVTGGSGQADIVVSEFGEQNW